MTTKKSRILIIDDDIIDQKAIKHLLITHCSCDVNVASTATEAFDDIIQKANCWDEKGYDIIFVDVHLPDVDGCNLIDILKKIVKSIKQKTRFIIITGDENFRNNKNVQFNPKEEEEVIFKPVTLEKFKRVHFIKLV